MTGGDLAFLAFFGLPLLAILWGALLWWGVVLFRRLFPPRPAPAAPAECRASALRPCRWRARYDEVMPSAEVNINGSCGSAAFLEALKLNLYVRDVCERCGAVRERPEHRETSC
jgi:hypothetical protein